MTSPWWIRLLGWFLDLVYRWFGYACNGQRYRQGICTFYLLTSEKGDAGLHRLDGPAKVTSTSTEWWVLGFRHRPGRKPAVISRGRTNQIFEWWNWGSLHREDGPAVIESGGRREWWWHGTLHRKKGPAIVNRFQGRKEWWVHGKRHREGGPAVITRDVQEWWVDDRFHRIDGPAVVFESGACEWWVNGVKRFPSYLLSRKRWWKQSRFVDPSSKDICFCWEIISKGVRLPCSHRFHERCLLEWFEREQICPYCRRLVPI